MTVFLIEKSFDGICSALFYAFEQKVMPGGIYERGVFAKNFTDTFIEIDA